MSLFQLARLARSAKIVVGWYAFLPSQGMICNLLISQHHTNQAFVSCACATKATLKGLTLRLSVEYATWRATHYEVS